MKVSFDFDGTLAYKHVQKYAKDLIRNEVEVFIVTTRWDRTSRFFFPNYFKMHGNQSWREVHLVAKRLGIPIRNCVFTNYEDKDSFFKDNSDFIWHLDDDEMEKPGIEECGVTFLGMWEPDWRQRGKKLLMSARTG